MEESYKRKLRIGRVLKAVLSDKSDFSEERLSTCNNCPLKEVWACSVCGCVITEKVKVKEEFCPENKWKDMKIVKNLGVGVANLSEDLVTISHVENTDIVNVDFKRSIKKRTPNTFKLKIVNARGNFFHESETTMDKIVVVKACGSCTRIVNKHNVPKKIEDGEYFELHIEYTPDSLGKQTKKVKVNFNDKTLFINFTATAI